MSDYDWRVAAEGCEGIHVDGRGDGYRDAAAVYSFDDVMPEAIVHEVSVGGFLRVNRSY